MTREGFSKFIDEYGRRPGGPFDTTIVPESACLACGYTLSKSVRWHDERAHKCPKCGGDFDREHIQILQRHLLAQMKEILSKYMKKR